MSKGTTNNEQLRLPTDLAAERRGLFRSGVLGIVVCAVGLAAGQVLLPYFLSFPTDFAGRLEFWARTQAFLFVWVAIAIGWVSRVRRTSLPDISGSAFGPPSPRLRIPLAFLQNTFEQAVVASAAQLALITLLSGSQLALVVSATALFCLGRITFLAGYDKGAPGRAFGFILTFLPTLLSYGLVFILLAASLVPGWV